MTKIRVLVATLAATFAMALFPATAQATHHCAELPPIEDHGIAHTIWVVCEDGPHRPVSVIGYVVCWLSPTC